MNKIFFQIEETEQVAIAESGSGLIIFTVLPITINYTLTEDLKVRRRGKKQKTMAQPRQTICSQDMHSLPVFRLLDHLL